MPTSSKAKTATSRATPKALPPVVTANHASPVAQSDRALRVAGLFAGVGGIELGLRQAGHHTQLLCEIDPGARAVLTEHFPGAPLVEDVRELEDLPRTDLLAAGFPCQDLSQAGRTAGIGGGNSGLVGHVLRLLETSNPRWLLLENVPFMLQLDRGEAMRFLASHLGQRGFRWAYRVVDTRSLGLPQRRQRVLLLASRDQDPRQILLPEERGEPPVRSAVGTACGFYWTEGLRGLGWAVDALPTLKGGSTIGIPSQPAIWMPDGRIVLPDLRDAERLQGFEPDWTLPAESSGQTRRNARWKLIGNAVSVPMSRWLGERLRRPLPYDSSRDHPLACGDRWPTAAWGEGSDSYACDRSPWPRRVETLSLADFLQFPPTPLSARAANGFLRRARAGRLRFAEGFLADVEAHVTEANGQVSLLPLRNSGRRMLAGHEAA